MDEFIWRMKMVNKNNMFDLVKARSLSCCISGVNAILIVFIGVSFLLSQYGFASDLEWVITSTTQNTTKIELPDGSKVTLNKNTELSYLKSYNKETREVNLKGEAYFELAHNDDLTFVINISDGTKIQEVLPAAFNVNTNNGSIVVDVQRGAVALLSPYNLLGHAVLDKGERGVLSVNNLSETKSTQQNYLSWKTGILTYFKTPLEEVISDLSKHYDTTIVLKDSSLKSSKLTGLFNRKTLDEVLEKLKLSLNVNYLYEDGRILIFKDE